MYHLFMFEDYYPEGGCNDLVKSFETLEDLSEFLINVRTGSFRQSLQKIIVQNSIGYRFNVLDSTKGKCILHGCYATLQDYNGSFGNIPEGEQAYVTDILGNLDDIHLTLLVGVSEVSGSISIEEAKSMVVGTSEELINLINGNNL